MGAGDGGTGSGEIVGQCEMTRFFRPAGETERIFLRATNDSGVHFRLLCSEST